MSKKAIMVSDGIIEYESYAEAGRVNGFHGASLGYAFAHSNKENECEFGGKTWVKIDENKTGEKKSAPYEIIAMILSLAVVTYLLNRM